MKIPSEKEQFRKIAVKMFLVIGIGFSAVLFGIIFIFTGLIFLSSDSIISSQYKKYSPYYILGGIFAIIIGFFAMNTELRELRDPRVPESLEHEISKTKKF